MCSLESAWASIELSRPGRCTYRGRDQCTGRQLQGTSNRRSARGIGSPEGVRYQPEVSTREGAAFTIRWIPHAEGRCGMHTSQFRTDSTCNSNSSILCICECTVRHTYACTRKQRDRRAMHNACVSACIRSHVHSCMQCCAHVSRTHDVHAASDGLRGTCIPHRTAQAVTDYK